MRGGWGLLCVVGMLFASPALADDARSGPSVRADILLRQTQREALERMAASTRLEAIERLRGLPVRSMEPERQAETLFRLADLYAEQGRYEYLGEMESHVQAVGACDRSMTCDASKLEPDHTTSRQWREQAVRVFERIRAKYPRYARVDAAVFHLGATYRALDRLQDAHEAFRWVARTQPGSAFAHDALVQVGEYHFEVGADPYAALRAYQRAAQQPGGRLVAYATYKAAWCLFNLGEHERAIRAMHQVVSADDAPDVQRLDLAEEGLRDLVRFYAEADQREEAEAYFVSIGRPELVRPVLRRLADLFFEQGRNRRAIEVWKRMVLLDPDAADNPAVQGSIIEATRRLGARPAVLAEIGALRDGYGPTSRWAMAQDDPAQVEYVMASVEAQLRGAAVRFHTTAAQYVRGRRVDEAQELYGLAQTAYEAYLELFPDRAEATDVLYALGELRYEQEDYLGAHDAYVAVVTRDPQGPHARFCAEGAVFAAEALWKAESDTPSIELSEADQRFLDAVDRYVSLYAGPHTQDMLYKSAYLLYDKRRFDEAAQRFRSVIALDPSSNEAEVAAQLILDALVVEERWEALRTTAQAFAAQSDLGTAAFRREAAQVEENATFRLVEARFDADGDADRAARGFVAFVYAFPDSAQAAKALYNATVRFGEAGRWADAMDVRRRLVHDDRFGENTPYYFDQLAALGFDHERMADFEAAATTYEMVWAQFTNSATPRDADDAAIAADAVYSAAVLRNGLGSWQRAITLYGAFASAFENDARLAEARLRVAGLWAEHDRYDEAAAAYAAYVAAPPEGASRASVWFAMTRQGRALADGGRGSERDALFDAAIEAYRGAVDTWSADEIEHVAEMMGVRAEAELDRYLALEIRAPAVRQGRVAEDRALQQALQTKARALVDLELSLTDIVNLGAGEWGIAALVALGRAYDDMARAVRSSDVPSYLTDAQRSVYAQALEDRAYVQEEKAVRAYGLAVEQAHGLTLYTEPAALAARRLGALRPDRYGGLPEMLVAARFVATEKSVPIGFETQLR